MKHVFCSAIIVFLLFVDILLAITFGWVRQAFGGVSMEELIFPFKSSASGNGHQLFCFFFPRSIAPIYRHICVDDGGLGKDAP